MSRKTNQRTLLAITALVLLAISNGCFLIEPEPPEGWSYVDITGMVMDVHHHPISGSTLQISQGGTSVEGSAISDSIGEYIFKDVQLKKQESFYVYATKPGYTTNYAEPVDLIVLKDRAAVTQNIWLYQHGNGAIVTIQGTVRNTEGLAIEGASVYIQYAKPSFAGAAVSPITDAPGHYIIENLLVMHLSTMLINPQSAYGSGASFSYLVPYDKMFNIDFVLPYYEITIDIQGKVLDSSDNPVEGANVNIRGFSGEQFSYNVITNADGVYVLNGIEVERPSNMYITASKNGVTSQTMNIVITSYVINIPDIHLEL